jgi:hypothetical protein
VNWKRGLHHIYLVLALGWIIYFLVLSPIVDHQGFINNAYDLHSNCMAFVGRELMGTPAYESEKKKCDDILAAELKVYGGT